MRKTKTVTITAEGRDKGKTFLLTEMPASQGEDWAVRALGAMARAGVEMPPDMIEGGWSAIGLLGVRAMIAASWAETKPLLDEMMGCVLSVQPALPTGRALLEDDIEEVATRLYLRNEIFELHAGFSVSGFLSTLGSRVQTAPGSSLDTATSPEASPPPSPPA